MALYFFHIQDGAFIPDRDGTECASIADVRKHAVAKAASILSSGDSEFWTGEEWQITAVDENGKAVLTLNFFATLGD